MTMTMKRIAFALGVAGALMGEDASAQVLGLGVRGGTQGLGADLAVALAPRVVVRAGIGFMPVEPTIALSQIDVTVDPPSKFYTAGLDLYLTNAMRVGAGIMLKPDDAELSAVFTENQQIGAQTFTPQQIGTLLGIIDSRNEVPYVLIGFGNHTAAGSGLYVDFGVAFMGEPNFELTSVGGTVSDQPATRTELEREELEFEEDAGPYLRFLPILNLGFRIGLG